MSENPHAPYRITPEEANRLMDLQRNCRSPYLDKPFALQNAAFRPDVPFAEVCPVRQPSRWPEVVQSMIGLAALALLAQCSTGAIW